MANRALISVDVEADGPTPGIDMYSMVCFGAVIVEDGLKRTFYGETAPISPRWVPEALAISGISREKHMEFPSPHETMKAFAEWVKKEAPKGATFITDNPAFDFAFINYYFVATGLPNPFGFSARRIGDLFCGVKNDYFYQWKRHRKTKHTHNPVDDAKGNAEALLYLRDELGFKLPI
jgi:hypothetical protein